MKKYTLYFLVFLMFVACNNKQKQLEEQQRIQDSLIKDSIEREYLKVKIDTVNAYYKRIVEADDKYMITFDRVSMLLGEEVKKYALNNEIIDTVKFLILNPESTTSTLEVNRDASIFILDDNDSLYVADIDDISDIPTNSLIQLHIQNKIVLFIKQLKLE